MDNKEHWEKVYGTKAQDAVSWFAPHLETSLNLIHQATNDKTAAIIDIIITDFPPPESVPNPPSLHLNNF